MSPSAHSASKHIVAIRCRLSSLSIALCLVAIIGLALPQQTGAAPQVAPNQAAACPSGYAIWANNQSRDETLDIPGSSIVVNGAVRSNFDIKLSGSSNRITSAVEYVNTFEDSGDANVYPSTSKVGAGPLPVTYTIGDYRPGGSAAQAAQQAGRYTVVNGDLDVADDTVLNGLYYVTGDAKLSRDGLRGTFTVVAEGKIDVSGSSHDVTPYAGGLLLFSNTNEVGAEVIKVAGSNSTFRGIIYGPSGRVELSGSSNQFSGSVVGDAVRLNGSSLTITFTGSFCPGAPSPDPSRPDQGQKTKKRDSGPPAAITIRSDDIKQTRTITDGVTFINVQITIVNTGGRARDVALVYDRRNDDDDDDDDNDDVDDFFALADVRFIQGAGFVRNLGDDDGQVRIGLGQNNIVRGKSTTTLLLTFVVRTVRVDGTAITISGQSINPNFRLVFDDSGGSRQLALPPIVLTTT
jgi:hypothetical protein